MDASPLIYTNYGDEEPMRKIIYKWHKSFVDTGCICAKKKKKKKKKSGRPSDESGACSCVISLLSAEIHKTGKQGTGCLSHDSVGAATEMTVFTTIQISTAAVVKSPKIDHIGDFCTDMLNAPQTGKFVFGQNCF
jgi:hypothetical protein